MGRMPIWVAYVLCFVWYWIGRAAGARAARLALLDDIAELARADGDD